MMESHCKEKKVESDEKVKRKPGRPRKHNVRPVVKDVPIGNDFNKATITTKTFTIKVENFDPDIDIWRNQISVSNVQHDDLECRCKDKIFPYTKPHKPGDIVEEYVFSKKNTKNIEKKENVFKNCFTVVILDQSLKPITIKICKKGSFQLTGCLSMESGEFCVLSLITNLQKKNPRWIPSLIYMTIKPVMTNVKFTIGYKISIVKALNFFENRKDIHEFFSYKLRVNPAINIKELLTEKDLENVPIRIVTYKNVNNKIFNRTSQEITLSNYIQTLSLKEKQKHFKEKHTTLLLFRSGSVILSGIHENVMKKHLNLFKKLHQIIKVI